MSRYALTAAAGLWLGLACGMVQAHEDPAEQAARLAGLPRQDPGDPAWHLECGERQRLAGQWAAAAAEFQLARTGGADAAVVARCQAALELDRGNPQGAVDALQAVPFEDSATFQVRGHALRRLGRLSEAAADLARALAGTPRPRPEDYLELSAVIVAQGDALVPQALAVLDQGVRRLGQTTALSLAAAELEVRRGQTDAALERLAAAPPVWRNTPDCLSRRGDILRQAGRGLEADAEFTAALERLLELPANRRATPAIRQMEQKLRSELGRKDNDPSGAAP